MFVCSPVIYSSNQEKKRSPRTVIAPKRHVQSCWPDNSTDGRVPRENHAARGWTWGDPWFDQYRLLWHPSHAVFAFIAEHFLFVFVSFGDCPTGFLIAQPRFFEQPPAIRE